MDVPGSRVVLGRTGFLREDRPCIGGGSASPAVIVFLAFLVGCGRGERYPVVVVHPTDLTVVEGETATFSVLATGPADLTYQWKKEGVDVVGGVGATTGTYTTPVVSVADSGTEFTCVVSGNGQSVTSEPGRLTVLKYALTDSCVAVDLTTGLFIQAQDVPDLLTNDAYKTTKLVLRRVAAGSFEMGDQTGGTEDDEFPVHTVSITQPFYLGIFETTQAQWQAVMCANPSYHTGFADSPRRPVEQVSWDDIEGCGGFMDSLSTLTSLDVRLPTEAEWEYCCKAGTSTDYSYGDGADGAWMWCSSNSGNATHEVATTASGPNPWGFHDMHGNVREWCGDWCSGTYYQYCLDNLIVDDPQGPVSGVTRVTRGGSYCDFGSDCRSAYRAAWDPTWCRRYVGFRLVSVGL